jgi:hypothetical protein
MAGSECEQARDLHDLPADALARVAGQLDVRQRFVYSLTVALRVLAHGGTYTQ